MRTWRTGSRTPFSDEREAHAPRTSPDDLVESEEAHLRCGRPQGLGPPPPEKAPRETRCARRTKRPPGAVGTRGRMAACRDCVSASEVTVSRPAPQAIAGQDGDEPTYRVADHRVVQEPSSSPLPPCSRVLTLQGWPARAHLQARSISCEHPRPRSEACERRRIRRAGFGDPLPPFMRRPPCSHSEPCQRTHEGAQPPDHDWRTPPSR